MAYIELRKAFHNPNISHEALYRERLEGEHSFLLGVSVAESPAFVCMVPDLYEVILEAARLDKMIFALQRRLPAEALSDYAQSLLIDEIVITNGIEGVSSTRREIGEVLERMKRDDRRGRFDGIVRKYLALVGRDEVPLRSCEDVRQIHDDLVLAEVLEDDPANAPDGELFRASCVHVVDRTGRPIHQGLEPESKIKEAIGAGLGFLGNDRAPLLVRVAVFHFLFGYAHPFYDGNGRTNRFISSYLVSQECEQLAGLSLSYAVKENIETYYKAFMTCEHPLNRGDLTPFAIAFSRIVVDGMERLKAQLEKRASDYEACMEKLATLDLDSALEAARLVTVATLFTFDGITVTELASKLGVSRQTAYKRLEGLSAYGLLVRKKEGHRVFNKLDVEQLLGGVHAGVHFSGSECL